MYTDGIKVDLTKEEIEEAKEWGAENKFSVKTLLDQYFFGNKEEFEEHGSIHTKFLSLALLASELARMYGRPKKSEIDAILRRTRLGVGIFTYGGETDFAKNYHMVLKQGEKLIQPVDVKAYKESEIHPPALGTPPLQARLMFWFRYSKIDLKAKTTIILVKETTESRFEVDFSQYK